MVEPSPIVVFSHLRWDWVYQRPQHLLSRFARTRQVIIIEEPVQLESGGHATWEFSQPAAGVTICRPRIATEGHGFAGARISTLKAMMAELVARFGLDG